MYICEIMMPITTAVAPRRGSVDLNNKLLHDLKVQYKRRSPQGERGFK